MKTLFLIISTLLFSFVHADDSGTEQIVNSINVTRYTELPLSEFQTKVMNEATKLSYACRLFRDIHGRWPNNLEEIKSKTKGIDYDIFLGRAVVTPLPDDTERIEIFDGKDTRAVVAVPVDFKLSEEQRNAAKHPDFKIEF